MPSMNDLFWLVQDLEIKGHGLTFKDKHMALHAAEKIVGNRSVAEVPAMGAASTPGYLYGPGDGSTRVMVRCFTRDDLLHMDLPIPA